MILAIFLALAARAVDGSSAASASGRAELTCASGERRLKSEFASLNAAKRFFPLATSVEDVIDLVRIEDAAAKNKTVRLAGICYFNRALNVQHTLNLEGDASIVITDDNLSSPSLMNIHASEVDISNLKFLGNSKSGDPSIPAVVIFQSKGVKLTNVDFSMNYGIAILVSQSSNILVSNSEFQSIGMKWAVTGLASDRRAAISVCCAPSENIDINSNTFRDIGLDAISITDTRVFKVEKNICNLWSTQTAQRYADFPACVFVRNSSHFDISDNGSYSAPGFGIDVSFSSDFSIEGNRLVSSGAGGILLSGVDTGTAEKNVIQPVKPVVVRPPASSLMCDGITIGSDGMRQVKLPKLCQSAR